MTMKTFQWIVDKGVDNLGTCPQISQAAHFLQQNEVVAFPTETVYGLGANAKSDEAVQKIYEAKGRPSDNPLIVHIASKDQLEEIVADIPKQAQQLMNAFWPGPLTIIFYKKDGVLSEKVTAGLNTVAVRMPDHPVALSLIRCAGLPIAAPSANRSGKPSPTTAKHVWNDLNGRIAGLIDGGETGVGVESTVVDCTGSVVQILRPGGITKEQLEEVVGKVEVDPTLKTGIGTPKSPGMKYAHYAPDAPLFLLDGDREWIQQWIHNKRNEGLKVGVLTTEEHVADYRADVVLACGQREDLATVAASLYDTLRTFDEFGVDMIVSEVFPTEGVGLAIMNRLLKAASYQYLKQEE
jgi:L-threonylcarbamoyladenylate synthase